MKNGHIVHADGKRVGTLIIMTTFMLALATTGARCEEDAHTFLRYYDAGTTESQHVLRRILTATANGISWANRLEKKNPLYCQPQSVSLDDVHVLALMRKAVATSPAVGKQPYGLALLIAFGETFPCPSTTKQQNSN